MVAVAASYPRRVRPAIRQTPYLPAEKKGEFRAVGILPIVRVIGSWRLSARSGSFAPPWAKEPRRSGGGFLKGGTVGDSLEWRSLVKCLHFAFHLDGERKVQSKQFDKPKFKIIHL